MKRLFVPLLLALGINGHLNAQQKHDLANAAGQVTPGALAASATRIGGLPLSEWAVIASILFIVLQAANLAWKWRRDARRERERQARHLPPLDTDVAPLGGP